jgi:transposase
MELSKHLAFGTYSAVHVPTSEDEAVKNYTRLRNTRVDALKKAKQNLLSFLLRYGRVFSEGKNYWTQIHYTWLKRQQFTDPVDQETFNEYLQEVHDQQDKVDRYNQRIEELSQLDAYREKVAKLRCFRGIETHTALSLVSEIGGFLPVRQCPAVLCLSGPGAWGGLKRAAGETGRHHKSREHPIEAAAH